MIRMSNLLRKQGNKYLFYEELIEPRVAETIARETGVTLLMLHGAHNISRDDFQAGVTFIRLMERNFDALKRGLQCR
jgi:zinc transport system substrate-binding protein